MTDRYDALALRTYTDGQGNQKTAYTRIGAMFSNSKGFTLRLDALPLPSLNDKGQVETTVLMMPPKQDGDAPRQQGSGQGRSRQMDDDIPGF